MKRTIFIICIISISFLSIMTFLNNFNYIINNTLFLNLISGLFGSVISCLFVFLGFAINDKSKKIDNQLVLRNMFSEIQRWEVHRTIATNDRTYWYKLSNEEIPNKMNEEQWRTSKAFSIYYELALNDYMGLFEIAYRMIKNGQLSKKDFKQIYLYRLKSLINNSHVNEKIYVTEHIYWKELRELISLYFI